MPEFSIKPCGTVPGKKCVYCGSDQPYPNHYLSGYGVYLHANCMKMYLSCPAGKFLIDGQHEVLIRDFSGLFRLVKPGDGLLSQPERIS